MFDLEQEKVNAQVDVHETIKQQITGQLGRLRAFFDRLNIKITDEPEQADDMADLVKVYNLFDPNDIVVFDDGDADDLDIVIHEEGHEKRDVYDEVRILDPEPRDQIEIGIKLAVRLAVDAQMNRRAAQKFFQSVRSQMTDLVSEQHHSSYTEGQWFSAWDLIQLANRWHLPLVLLNQNNHWHLILKATKEQDNIKLLVYDPLVDGEKTLEFAVGDYYQIPGIQYNLLGSTQLESGIYDLSLFGDERIADGELINAKRAHLQIDGDNCGLACVMETALRSGAVKGSNAFKEQGRDQMRFDTGLNALLRSEILGPYGLKKID